MKPARIFSLATPLIFLASRAFAQTAHSTSATAALDLPAYLAELDRWGSAVIETKQEPAAAAALLRKLPKKWSVSNEGETFLVPTDWLRKELEAIEKDPKSASSCEQFQQHIEALRAEPLRLEGLPSTSPAAPRQKLEEILERKEFRGVHGPTWWDALRNRIATWLTDLLETLLGASRQRPTTGQLWFGR